MQRLLNSCGEFRLMSPIDKILIKQFLLKKIYYNNMTEIALYIGALSHAESIGIKPYGAYTTFINIVKRLQKENLEIKRLIELKGGRV